MMTEKKSILVVNVRVEKLSKMVPKPHQSLALDCIEPRDPRSGGLRLL